MRQGDREHRQLPGEQPQYQPGCRDTGSGPDTSEDQTLRQQLAQEAAETSSERRADGDLAPPLDGAAQQESSDVGAGNREHQPDRSKQEDEREFVLTRRRLTPGRD